jgi:hypothetical protein
MSFNGKLSRSKYKVLEIMATEFIVILIYTHSYKIYFIMLQI